MINEGENATTVRYGEVALLISDNHSAKRALFRSNRVVCIAKKLRELTALKEIR